MIPPHPFYNPLTLSIIPSPFLYNPPLFCDYPPLPPFYDPTPFLKSPLLTMFPTPLSVIESKDKEKYTSPRKDKKKKITRKDPDSLNKTCIIIFIFMKFTC